MSAEKAARSSLKKQLRNKAVRSTTRTYVSAAFKDLDNDGEKTDATSSVKRAIRSLDKAAKHGVIHANNAARRKSRLMKRLHSVPKPETSDN